jgi:hypothetical protein
VPNCDFYATPDDHEEILGWLFAEKSCAVYELSSSFEREIFRFETPKEVLAQFDRRYTNGERWKSVHLQLYVFNAGPPFSPRRVPLDPKFCEGATFRYAAEGWGLVQLYLHRPTNKGLDSSHTNHFTQKRAEAVAATSEARAEVDAWDFNAITSFSSRLNHKIKSLSVGKIKSCPVLPGALELWKSGTSLLPFKLSDNSVALHADA